MAGTVLRAPEIRLRKLNILHANANHDKSWIIDENSRNLKQMRKYLFLHARAFEERRVPVLFLKITLRERSRKIIAKKTDFLYIYLRGFLFVTDCANRLAKSNSRIPDIKATCANDCWGIEEKGVQPSSLWSSSKLYSKAIWEDYVREVVRPRVRIGETEINIRSSVIEDDFSPRSSVLTMKGKRREGEHALLRRKINRRMYNRNRSCIIMVK